MTGTDIMEVACKDSTAAHPDLLGGRVSMIFDTITAINLTVRGMEVDVMKFGITAPSIRLKQALNEI
jgi:hypothetical protein